MKLSVIALDYDGTIASGDRLEPAVRDAIADARTRGIVVLLVTGRILSELQRVAGDLHFVDGVVAENGAVLHFPDSGHTSLLAPLVPGAFVAELERRRIPCTPGQCLVDGASDDAPRILDAIRDLELPLVLLFNRSRVMTLPQGVSKSTGLRAALDMLRLSPRNTVAVGDAENDHALLSLAEVGAAAEWGSPALRSAADVVVAGAGPEAVAGFIREIARRGMLPRPARARRRLRLGYTEDGREFALAVRGRNVLVAGDPKSGKSWLAGLLSEQLILHGYCVCVIDPEGDYRSLESLPGVSVLGGEDPAPTPRELLRALHYPDRSVVIDLSRMSHEEKVGYTRRPGAIRPARGRGDGGMTHEGAAGNRRFHAERPGGRGRGGAVGDGGRPLLGGAGSDEGVLGRDGKSRQERVILRPRGRAGARIVPFRQTFREARPLRDLRGGRCHQEVSHAEQERHEPHAEPPRPVRAAAADDP
jgi:hypothetical protein